MIKMRCLDCRKTRIHGAIGILKTSRCQYTEAKRNKDDHRICVVKETTTTTSTTTTNYNNG